MSGPLPSTDALALLLPSWPTRATDEHGNPTDPQWAEKHVPWFWSEDDFGAQTRALVRAKTPGRELVAWLLHGVRWGTVQEGAGSIRFDDTVRRWCQKGGYFREWTRAVGDTIPMEALEAHCKRLPWHPAWRNQDLSRIIDDFCWAHELRGSIARQASMRKPLSTLGALELAHCTPNFDGMYESAHRVCTTLGNSLSNGPEASKILEVLKSTTLGSLHPAFVRGIVVAALLSGDDNALEAKDATRVWELWHHQLNPVELDWWKVKSKGMMLSEKSNAHFLQLGVHPFFLIHEDKRQELELLRDLQPQAFRIGRTLSALLSNNDPTSLPLPELGMEP